MSENPKGQSDTPHQQTESWGTQKQGTPAKPEFEPQGTHPDQPLQEPDPSQVPASNVQQPQE